MSRKNDAFYFDGFKSSARCAHRASVLLIDVMNDFEPTRLEERMKDMHRIEQEADDIRHGMMDELVTAFITPFDREDIGRLSQTLDDVTDGIEGVLHRMYYDNVTAMRQDALDMAGMIGTACEQMVALFDELPKFRRSKSIRQRVFAINRIEQDIDRAYIAAMRTLHTTCDDPMQVFAWHEVYTHLERCADACEHVADVADGIVMKNN